MKKIIIFSIILSLTSVFACKPKEKCEYEHTGTLSITNNTGDEIEVYINQHKLSILKVNQTQEFDYPIGTHKVEALKYPNEWSYSISVNECKNTSLQIPE